MTKFKDDLACNIVLVSVLALTGIYLVLLTLNLFDVFEFEFPKTFSYITAYVLVVVCLALFICAMLVINRKKFLAPTWLRIMFYFAFFAFTNIYYAFGLFESMFWVCVMVGYISFLSIICALSIFYNSLKDDKNRLQVSNNFLLSTVFAISLAILFVISLIILVISTLSSPTTLLASSNNYVAIMLVMFLVSIFTTISFGLSLKKRKSWVNACLVKIIFPARVSRSTKQK